MTTKKFIHSVSKYSNIVVDVHYTCNEYMLSFYDVDEFHKLELDPDFEPVKTSRFWFKSLQAVQNRISKFVDKGELISKFYEY